MVKAVIPVAAGRVSGLRAIWCRPNPTPLPAAATTDDGAAVPPAPTPAPPSARSVTLGRVTVSVRAPPRATVRVLHVEAASPTHEALGLLSTLAT